MNFDYVLIRHLLMARLRGWRKWSSRCRRASHSRRYAAGGGQAADVAAFVDVRAVICLECDAATVYRRIATDAGGDRAGRDDDSRAELTKHENEMGYLLGKLADIERDNATELTWSEVGDAWQALLGLRAQIDVERGQTVLDCICADEVRRTFAERSSRERTLNTLHFTGANDRRSIMWCKFDRTCWRPLGPRTSSARSRARCRPTS